MRFRPIRFATDRRHAPEAEATPSSATALACGVGREAAVIDDRQRRRSGRMSRLVDAGVDRSDGGCSAHAMGIACSCKSDRAAVGERRRGVSGLAAVPVDSPRCADDLLNTARAALAFAPSDPAALAEAATLRVPPLVTTAAHHRCGRQPAARSKHVALAFAAPWRLQSRSRRSRSCRCCRCLPIRTCRWSVYDLNDSTCRRAPDAGIGRSERCARWLARSHLCDRSAASLVSETAPDAAKFALCAIP